MLDSKVFLVRVFSDLRKFLKALFGCTSPILLGVHFWCENGLLSIHKWLFCMGQQNGPSATKQGLRVMGFTYVIRLGHIKFIAKKIYHYRDSEVENTHFLFPRGSSV